MKLRTKQSLSGMMLVSPFLVGSIIFYFIPFVVSVYYSFTSGLKEKHFVGLKNYMQLFQNQSFILALKNTIIFMLIAIPLLICTGLLLAAFSRCLGRWGDIVRGIMIIPLIVPIASVIKVWQILFDDYGIVNRVLASLSLNTQYFFKGGWVMTVVIMIFIWKNCGYLALIYSVALSNIPKSYIEAARIDGGSKWKVFGRIILPMLRPTTFFALLISIISSFKIFREVYLLTGQYPDTAVYFVQHYMNNNFYNLNYQKLSTASVILSILITVVIAVIFLREKKAADME